jgi:hypothetical protein
MLGLRRGEPALESIEVSLALLGGWLRTTRRRLRLIRRRRLRLRRLSHAKASLPLRRASFFRALREPEASTRATTNQEIRLTRRMAMTAIETSHRNHRRSLVLWFSTQSDAGREASNGEHHLS